MGKQCIECEQEKPESQFYKTNSQCKECVKKRKRGEYHSDIETSRLSAKVRYETSPKEAARRVRKFLERYGA